MGHSSDVHDEIVLAAVLADPVCAAVLDRLPSLGLTEWWLTAGAVFQNVWNSVEGKPAGYGIKDYDVFYHDDSDLSWEAEDGVIRAADELMADIPAPLEVRNQARVHLWYEKKFGKPCPPFSSATDAIRAFASTACCVGVTRDESGLRLYAPFGLDDVLGMHLRPHRRLAPKQVYDAKVCDYAARWPSLTVEPW